MLKVVGGTDSGSGLWIKNNHKRKGVWMKARYKVLSYIVLLLFVFTGCKKNKRAVRDESYFPLALATINAANLTQPYESTGYEIKTIKIVDSLLKGDTVFFKFISKRSHTIGEQTFFLYKDSAENIWAKDSSMCHSHIYFKKITKDIDYIINGSRVTFVSKDTVEVPAGKFKCFKLKMFVLDDTTGFYPDFYQWYAKGVGLIKQWAEKEGTAVGQILIKARVGGIKYP